MEEWNSAPLHAPPPVEMPVHTLGSIISHILDNDKKEGFQL